MLKINSLYQANTRGVHATVSLLLKKIVQNSTDNMTIVEAIVVPSPTSHMKFNVPKGCCPLCALNKKVQYTDVLIIKQFLDEKGNVLNPEITGLCRTKHSLLRRLTEFAHKAGLLKPYIIKNPDLAPKKHWDKYNRIYLDKPLWPYQTVQHVV